MPRLEEVDDMLKQGERIQVSLQRMRDVVINHHQANIVESPQDSRYRPMNGYDDNSSNYGDDPKSGGFAGGDSKTRKRGVSLSSPLLCRIQRLIIPHSELLHLADAIAATERRRQSGAEDLMVLEHCATLADCVRHPVHVMMCTNPG